MTETTEDKARRLLTEGCLQIRSVDAQWVTATIRGDTGRYHLGLTPGGWWCSCLTPGPRCSHLTALRLVTIATRTETK